MKRCIFCGKPVRRFSDYYTAEICKTCYLRMGINKLKDIEPPVDNYMKSLVREEDSAYVDALNLYSTLFPKSLSEDLFGIFLANLGDEEMSEAFINSIIIAARSIWFFGNSNLKREDLDTNKIHSLHVFGNIVGISIMGHLVETYKNLGLDLEDETNLSKIIGEIDLTMIKILENTRDHDDGTLENYITKTIDVIESSEIYS